MKTHVVKTTPDAMVGEAVDLMDIYQVDSLPVIDAEGALCGIIAEQDIVRYCCRTAGFGGGSPQTAIGSAIISVAAAQESVGRVMNSSVASVQESETVDQIARSIIVNDWTRVPVLRDDGQVVGTLNRIDVLQAAFEGLLPDLVM